MSLFSDFKGDFAEAKKLWKNSSGVSKILISISIFLTTTSLMSLSDAIIKWRYWFRDFLEFRAVVMDYVLQPFYWLELRFDWITVPEWFGDVMTLVVLVVAALCRGVTLEFVDGASARNGLLIYFIVTVSAIAIGLLNLSAFWISFYFLGQLLFISLYYLFYQSFITTSNKKITIFWLIFSMPLYHIRVKSNLVEAKELSLENAEYIQSKFRILYLGTICIAVLLLVVFVGIQSGMSATLK